ncbi:long-chain-fatty-acid--CoA ligase [Candidatus Paracaedibacter symbiosus]|uniref:long-chain-fatty-acid--CoA ligase n=1 Tax=Candidatus Paracaedibacter symbiosus TaxID=244582 RepID=UPI000A017AB2|nr:long-chain fatty acid--CoA ligase [Candidatus Paracaedibacter symbiosus]
MVEENKTVAKVKTTKPKATTAPAKPKEKTSKTSTAKVSTVKKSTVKTTPTKKTVTQTASEKKAPSKTASASVELKKATSKTTTVKKTTKATSAAASTLTKKTSTKASKPLSQAYPWLKKYPQNIQWDVEIEPKPLYEMLHDTIQKVPHSSCINFLGKKFSYEQVGDLVNRAAKGLQTLGVKKGTRVGLFMPNAPYYVVMYFAIVQAGGIVVNYNPLYTDAEVKHQIDDSETEIMVTLDLDIFYKKLEPMLEKTELKKLIICSVGKALPFFKGLLFSLIRMNDRAHVAYSDHIISYDDIINNDGKYTPVKIDPLKDVALFQYTGGTTGVPKGAMLTHANVYCNAIQASMWFVGFEYGQEKILAGLPLFHVFAMTAVMTLAIKIGAEMIMMFPRFTVEEAMHLINKYKVTFFPAVPTMYGMINNHPDVRDFNLSSLRMCLSGGAGLPRKIKQDFERLTGCKLVEAYGLSETSPAATSNPMESENKEGSIGIPFPGTTVRIVSLEDPNKEMPLGEKGQIAIKGPQVMLGYWNHSAETTKTFAGDFFLTGDVGYMDEDGYTFLVDRIKDVIICSGFNVYPRMVEEVIYKHPAIEEVTVIGVPDEKRGETVKAFVKLKADQVLSEEELLTYLHDKLTPIEIPKFIEFREALPKTMIGKLSKKELKAEEHERRLGSIE